MNNLAYVLASTDRCEQAHELNQGALALHPSQPDLLDTLARVLRCLHRDAEAEKALAEAYSGRPDDMNIALNLADVRIQLGQFDLVQVSLDDIQRHIEERRHPNPLHATRLETLRQSLRRAMAGASS